MTPFQTDPRWYEEHWCGDPPAAREAEAAPKRHTGRFGRVAVCLAVVTAVPALTYFGYEAVESEPRPRHRPRLPELTGALRRLGSVRIS